MLWYRYNIGWQETGIPILSYVGMTSILAKKKIKTSESLFSLVKVKLIQFTQQAAIYQNTTKSRYTYRREKILVFCKACKPLSIIITKLSYKAQVKILDKGYSVEV